MANRRMFSMDIVDTDKFLEMPTTTQCLYFHLGMRADDEGFISSPKRITKIVGCNDDDLKLLIAKGYLIPFDSGVIVISDWNINNWIRSDRKHDTRFLQEKSMLNLENDMYVLTDTLQPSDNQASTACHTEDRLGKDRLGKVREGEYINYQLIADMYNKTCVSFPKLTKLSDTRKKAIKARLKHYSVDDFGRLFQMAEESSFLKGQNNRNWSATFDWLIKDANMAKVLDGNYADKSGQQQQAEYDISEEDKRYNEYLSRILPDNYEPSPDDPFQ